MIDYDKLQEADELGHKLPKGMSITISINSGDIDNNERLFCAIQDFNLEIKPFFNLDDLIIKLRELTQPDPKYKINQRVWFTIEHGRIDSGQISKIYDDIYYYGIDDWTIAFHVDDLYPTKSALIEAQVKYWGGLLCEENGGTFDGVKCLRDEYCNVSGVKLGKRECEHESDGKLHDTIPVWPPTGEPEARVQYKCKKCGEFYR